MAISEGDDFLRRADALRDRVDESRRSLDGPTENEDELLAEAERLEALALVHNNPSRKEGDHG